MLDSSADQSCIWVLALGVVASPPCAELCCEGPRGRATGPRGPGCVSKELRSLALLLCPGY